MLSDSSATKPVTKTLRSGGSSISTPGSAGSRWVFALSFCSSSLW